MLAGDVVRYAVGTMRRRKLRTALTSLGVTMAIAVIVALLSITQGLQTSVQDELGGLGTNTLTVTARDGGALLVNDTGAVERMDGVTMAIPLIQRTGLIKSDTSTVRVSIIGLDMDKYRQVYSDAFVADRGSIPESPSSDTIIIGERVCDPGQNGTVLYPVGSSAQVLRLDTSNQGNLSLSYEGKVAGVLNAIGPMSVGALSDSAIYIPVEQAEKFYGTDQCSLMLVELQDGSQSTRERVTAALNERYDGQVVVSSSGVINSVASRVFSLLDLFFLGVAAITLLIAGVGIMNTMTISLIERTREIGTLKSLGLRDRKVLGIFLCEASIVGLLGGVFGTVLGFALASAIASFLNGGELLASSGLGVYANITIVPELSLSLGLLTAAFGVLVSVVFSLYPAWRASKMSPMVALRHE